MKILLAVDGSDNALRAMEYIAKLAKGGLNIQLSIITVIPITDDLAVFLGVDEAEYKHIVEMRTQPIFEPFMELVKELTTVKVDFLVEQGDIADKIVETANLGSFDKIIIGSRGLGNYKKFFLGSVSQKVVKIATCPVVIVK